MSRLHSLKNLPLGQSTVCNFVNFLQIDKPEEEVRQLQRVNQTLKCIDCSTCHAHVSFNKLREMLNVQA